MGSREIDVQRCIPHACVLVVCTHRGFGLAYIWQGKPDYVQDGINCCADDLIALHSYKAEAYQDISRWFEYEHFEAGYQRLKRKLDNTLEELHSLKNT